MTDRHGTEALIRGELQRQAREAQEAKEERLRVQKEILEKDRKELAALALAESGESKEELDPEELQKAIDVKIRAAQDRKFSLMRSTSEHIHVDNRKAERRIQAHRDLQMQGGQKEEDLMAERAARNLQFREQLARERNFRRKEKLKREVETKRVQRDNLKDIAARADRIAAESAARWEKAQVNRRAVFEASRAGRYRYGFGPEDGILPGDRDPVPEPELPKGARGFDPASLPPEIVAEMELADAKAERALSSPRSRSGSPQSERLGSPLTQLGSMGMTSTTNSLGSLRDLSLNPEVEISVRPKPGWKDLKESRAVEDMMRRTALEASCEKRVLEARWLRRQRLLLQHQAVAELNATNALRTRGAAARRKRVEDDLRRQAEKDAEEAVRLAEEARLERLERLEGIGKRTKEANMRKYLEHAQRKEGITGLQTLTVTAGLALKNSMTDKNKRIQNELQREKAQLKLERNLERKRKYDERVAAELEAQGIDPLQEQAEKNARINDRLEKAKARRKWSLYRELFNPETGKPPRRAMRRTWSTPFLPQTPPYPLGAMPDDGDAKSDGSIVSADIVDYILDDHGPYEKKGHMKGSTNRPAWKNISN